MHCRVQQSQYYSTCLFTDRTQLYIDVEPQCRQPSRWAQVNRVRPQEKCTCMLRYAVYQQLILNKPDFPADMSRSITQSNASVANGARWLTSVLENILTCMINMLGHKEKPKSASKHQFNTCNNPIVAAIHSTNTTKTWLAEACRLRQVAKTSKRKNAYDRKTS